MKFLRIGIVKGTHGLDGELKITFTTDNVVLFDNMEYVLLGKDRKVVFSGKLEYSRLQNDMLVVKLEKINDLDTALKYKGFEVLVPENAIPEEAVDEVYWFKIEGSRVVDENNDEIGILVDYIESGSNDVFRIKRNDGGFYLISNNKDHVLSIDVDKKLVTVNSEGLVDEDL
jgi:16S rRNA processing protein RimM